MPTGSALPTRRAQITHRVDVRAFTDVKRCRRT